jgi:hypothetical protein
MPNSSNSSLPKSRCHVPHYSPISVWVFGSFQDPILKSFNRFPFHLKQVCPAVALSGLVTICFLLGAVVSPTTNPQTGGPGLRITSPGDRVAQLYPQSPVFVFPFSRFLRHVGKRWVYFPPPPHALAVLTCVASYWPWTVANIPDWLPLGKRRQQADSNANDVCARINHAPRFLVAVLSKNVRGA